MAEKKTKSAGDVLEMELGDVQAAVAAMIAEAKAEAAAIVAAAKAEAEGAQSAKDEARAKAIADDLARGEELVEVKLFRDTGKYKDDVFVAVNGENCVIKRGEKVKIKRKFAEVLDNSDRQDYETAVLCDSMSRQFEKDTKAHLG